MPNINQIIAGFFNRDNYTLRNFTAFLIILLPIQYGPILGTSPINPLKVVFMAIAGIVWLVHFVPNKAFFFGSIYLAWIFFVAAGLYPASFRASTLLYTVLFLVTFFCIYTAVWEYQVFNLEFFTKLIKCFILTIIVFLLLQQLCLILGYRSMPFLNLYSYLNRGIGANSLFFEPSHFGRVLCVLYYAILKCTEYRQRYKVSLTQIFSNDLNGLP